MKSRFNTVVRFLKERHERRVALATLARMDDHQLADIGIERGSMVEAVSGHYPRRPAVHA